MLELALVSIQATVPVDAELVESVKEVGVMNPVSVAMGEDGSFAIRDGHRRVAAARAAGLTSIPCEVYKTALSHEDIVDACNNLIRHWGK